MLAYTYYVRIADDAPLMALLDKASEYRRKLVEIELTKRERLRGLEDASHPEVAAARRELERIDTIEHPTREDYAAKRAATAALKDVLAPYRAVLKEHTEAAKVAKAVRLAEMGNPGPRIVERVNHLLFLDQVEALGVAHPWAKYLCAQADALAAIKDARAHCGIPSMTYLLVEEDVQSAARTPIGFGKHRRFERVGVGTAVQIEQLPPETWATRSGCQHAYTAVSVEVCRAPKTWVTGTIKLHRPLPAGARIKVAELLLDTSKRRRDWRLKLTVEAARDRGIHDRKGTCAVAVRWDVRGSDVVVAAGYDDSGNYGELLLDPHQGERNGIVANELKASALISAADSWRDKALPVLLAEMTRQPELTMPRWVDGIRIDVTLSLLADGLKAPTQMRQIVRSLVTDEHRSQWHVWKADRLARGLDLMCEHHEFTGTDLQWLHLWERKDEHLRTWARNILTRNAKRRKQRFRMIANELERRYERVILPARDLAAKAKKERGTKDQATRQVIAVGLLREEIAKAFGPERTVRLDVESDLPARDEAVRLLELHCAGAEQAGPSKMRALRQRKRPQRPGRKDRSQTTAEGS